MLIKMAAPNDSPESYFKVGSQVSCQTCHGLKVQGEVMAFDVPTRMLALKTAASGKATNYDIRIINLFLATNVELIREPTETPPPPPALNLQKLNFRCNHEVDAKKNAVFSIGVDVTPEAQKLFNTLYKTLKCRWHDKSIIVMDEVTISPPYGLENCKGKEGTLNHVRKIIEKHIREQSETQVQPQTHGAT
ncbi:protein LSM12-like [Saccoglossus kowalevskii]|uniref:Protein LSM12 homolog n=1 Tax=Saccoglossus kowalevskii TaxID=10224 RepID=A0ABM0GWG8_SACKO|nr:PREDICTED: protein LSM12 homolog [Saccoglossus kowalevskii]